jgi:tRNA modification GTPase
VHLDDTIVAISTPPGRGGIGVVRLAGEQAREIAAAMLRHRNGKHFTDDDFKPNHAVFAELIEAESSTRIDECVVTFFAKPHSYTTDDIVEISAHGSPVVLRHMVETAMARGARLAQPGEFTMRAFLHGRLDLTQAEAVHDLIESQTLYQAKTAAQQLDGALSRRIQPIKRALMELIAALEAGVDFAEDDIGVMPDAQITVGIAAVRAPLEALAASFAYGRAVHEGITLAIVGRPNVGKSSLFNRLVERERAIVTAAPGTTRDLVTETVAIGGIPVKLVDTAGIRASSDEAESIGIQKSYEALADADLVLVVTEAAGETEEDAALVKSLAGRKALRVANKSDLVRSTGSERAPAFGPVKTTSFVDGALAPEPASRNGCLPTSAITGAGIAELREAILREIGGDASTQAEAGFLTNTRHQGLVSDSLHALEKAAGAVRDHVPHEMLLLDLYAALRPLDEITGQTSADDILNLIFGKFCIGK